VALALLKAAWGYQRRSAGRVPGCSVESAKGYSWPERCTTSTLYEIADEEDCDHESTAGTALGLFYLADRGWCEQIGHSEAVTSATRRPERTWSMTMARYYEAYEGGIFLLAEGRHSHKAGP
jgi:hypothetical protein